MSTSSGNDPVVDEKAWQAWVEKGKREDKATARKLNFFVGTAVVLLISAALYYFKFR
jgi:hypothetical protein